MATATAREIQASIDTVMLAPAAPKPKLKLEKKMGVWINGVLKLQTRDRDAIDNYAQRMMNDTHRYNVWVAPIGSFVTV